MLQLKRGYQTNLPYKLYYLMVIMAFRFLMLISNNLDLHTLIPIPFSFIFINFQPLQIRIPK